VPRQLSITSIQLGSLPNSEGILNHRRLEIVRDDNSDSSIGEPNLCDGARTVVLEMARASEGEIGILSGIANVDNTLRKLNGLASSVTHPGQS